MQETRRIQLGTKIFSEDASSVTSAPSESSKVIRNTTTVTTQTFTSTSQSISKVPAMMMHNNKPILVNLTSTTGSSFGTTKCVTLASQQMVPIEKSLRISMITNGSTASNTGTVSKRIGLSSVGNGVSAITGSGSISIGRSSAKSFTNGTSSLAFPSLKVVKSSLETNKSSPIDLLSTPITDFSSIRSNTTGSGNVSRSMFLQVVKPGILTSSASNSTATTSATLSPASSPPASKASCVNTPANIEIVSAIPTSTNNSSTSNNIFIATNSPSQITAVCSQNTASTSTDSSKKSLTSTTPAKSSGGRGSKKHPENYVKRPMNRFMVWSQIQRKKMFQNRPDVHNAQISKQLGQMWRQLSEKEREPFAEMAKQIEKEHAEKYPDYKYRPRKKQFASSKKDSNSLLATPTKSSTTKTSIRGVIPATTTENFSQNCNQTKAKSRFNIGNSPFSNVTVVNNATPIKLLDDRLMIHSPPSCSDGSILSTSDSEIQDLLEPAGRKSYSINTINTSLEHDIDMLNGTASISVCDPNFMVNERTSGLLTPVSSMSDNANQDSSIDFESWDFQTRELIPNDFDLFDFPPTSRSNNQLTDAGHNIGSFTGFGSLTSTLHNPMLLLSDLAEGDDEGYFSPLFESPAPSSGSQLEDSLSAWLDDNSGENWLQNDTLSIWMDTFTPSSGPLSAQDYTYAPDNFP